MLKDHNSLDLLETKRCVELRLVLPWSENKLVTVDVVHDELWPPIMEAQTEWMPFC